MLRPSFQCSYMQRVVQNARRLFRSFETIFPAPVFPARYAGPRLCAALPVERLSRARRAALLGVGRLPQRPGLWVRTTGDGTQRVYRVKDHNGELYATVGRFAPVAVPTARMPGYWDHVG